MWSAAEAIDAMLLEPATDKTLLPTTRQIRDLLDRLEARSQGAGFADSVVGWHHLLCQHSGALKARFSYARDLGSRLGIDIEWVVFESISIFQKKTKKIKQFWYRRYS